MKRILFLICIFVMLVSSAAAAAEAGEKHDGQPITIRSNELQADTKSRTATFLGKVVAKQGDITIFADRLIVRYAEQGGDVERVEADGNVRIVQKNRIGTAQHGVYQTREGKITLSGSPKVIQGKDMVTGREITYFVNEERSVVTGGPETRVEAVLYPKGKGKNDAQKP
jgi:lipopolysaccharide export system protein LptA